VLALFQDFITTTIGDHGLVAIFILMFLESACVPIPSEVTMLFGGAMTATAFAGAGNELSFAAVVVAGVLGNLLGSWAPHEVDRAHAFFEERGEATVFVSRLLPVVRTFISLPAGVAEMPFWRFTLYTLLGVIPWCLGLTWLGARLGEHWTTVENVLAPVSWLIAFAVVVAIVLFVARRWSQVRAEYAARDAGRDSGSS
jgi:membrane protein DedA with SNARE-associated domain